MQERGVEADKRVATGYCKTWTHTQAVGQAWMVACRRCRVTFKLFVVSIISKPVDPPRSYPISLSKLILVTDCFHFQH